MIGRASKWKRQKNPERIVLQPRDRKILGAAYSFRILSREQIETLFNFKCTRRVNSRLRKLYDNHYLSRSFLPTVRGSAKAIYYLGPKGIPVASEDLGVDTKLIKQKHKAISKLKGLFLKHALELNDIRIAFSIGLKKQPDMKLERWINDYDCKQEYRAPGLGKDITKRFRPDGYLRFYYHDNPFGFFLEYDRSTMTLGRFTAKVRSYIEFQNLEYYRHRFGLPEFRVLVITKTGKRLNNLKRTVETVDKSTFRFTTIDQIRPSTIFNPIWLRAGEQGKYPLIG
jgi:hypothetical protein